MMSEKKGPLLETAADYGIIIGTVVCSNKIHGAAQVGEPPGRRVTRVTGYASWFKLVLLTFAGRKLAQVSPPPPDLLTQNGPPLAMPSSL